jgi:hypothetical protein
VPRRSDVALTVRLIERLKPRAAQYAVFDSRVTGLMVIVHTSGRKAFAVRYVTAAGVRRNKTIGDCSLATAEGLDRARRRAQAILDAAAAGEDLPQQEDDARTRARSRQLRGRGRGLHREVGEAAPAHLVGDPPHPAHERRGMAQAPVRRHHQGRRLRRAGRHPGRRHARQGARDAGLVAGAMAVGVEARDRARARHGRGRDRDRAARAGTPLQRRRDQEGVGRGRRAAARLGRLRQTLHPARAPQDRARRGELDDAERPTLWTVPHERTKSNKRVKRKRIYLVPLPPLAQRIVRALPKREDAPDLLFPGRRAGQPLNSGM